MVVLSFVLASTIGGPMRRAGRKRAGGCGGACAHAARSRNYTFRRDEIGHLSGSLRSNDKRALSNASRRSRALRPNVSHELKNH